MNTFPFIPGLTWRKAGFYLFSDSLAYREVIDANPGWDISGQPAPGTMMNNPGTGGRRGGLNQIPGQVPTRRSNQDPKSYYPYSSWDEFADSLTRYPPSALKDVEKYNGWSSTSDDVVFSKK